MSRHDTSKLSPISAQQLNGWAKRFGVQAELGDLPWLQLGPIPWNTYPFLGTSAKAYSLLPKLAPTLPPNTDQAPRLSCWHSVLFRDTNNNMYFSPKLIRAGITRIGQFTTDLQERLPPTWAPRYKSQLGQAWPRPQMTPPQETSAIFLGGLEHKGHAQVPDAPGTPGPLQTPETWQAWTKLSITAQTPLVYADSVVEKTASRDQAGQLAPSTHTLPGGWQTGRHAARPSRMPVPPPRIPDCSAMHGTSDIRRYHGNRPGRPPVGHASSIPPEPAGPGHVDCSHGLMEPAQRCQIS